MGLVIATAGHIDHGKSRLVQALTGLDPDRLDEERRRGMSIELGFAPLALPGGRQAALVDVPGHVRFIRNMLAGVHGVDAVLLVVAANEGVMPQTREHLEIVDLLELNRGVVALTKVDLVDDAELLELVTAEVQELLEPTSLRGAPILPVSAETGSGMDELRRHLEALPERSHRRGGGGPRLPVDRAFSIRGFGTVVTGTLLEGVLSAGEELILQPAGRPVRVRGLQQHHREVSTAEAGTRVAVNITGADPAEVVRGDVLARPGRLPTTRRVDAAVRVAREASQALHSGERLTFHTGTAEIGCRLQMLGVSELEPGRSGWLQLDLEGPVAALPGDRYVLRRPSPTETVGGGLLLDVTPRRHRRMDPEIRASLERRRSGGLLREELRKHRRGVNEAQLRAATGDFASRLEDIGAHRAGDRHFDADIWAELRRRAMAELHRYHQAHPVRARMPRSELRSRLRVPGPVSDTLLAELQREGSVECSSDGVGLPGRGEPAQTAPARRLLDELRTGGLAPPRLSEAIVRAGASGEHVRALARAGEIVLLSADLALTSVEYGRAREMVRDLIVRSGPASVAEVRDLLGTSRRHTLALLVHLDVERVTRRENDLRILADAPVRRRSETASPGP